MCTQTWLVKASLKIDANFGTKFDGSTVLSDKFELTLPYLVQVKLS